MLAGVLTAVLAAYVGPVHGYLGQRSDLARERAALARLEDRRDELARQVKALDQPAVLAARARELGLLRPGEQGYVVRGLPGD